MSKFQALERNCLLVSRWGFSLSLTLGEGGLKNLPCVFCDKDTNPIHEGEAFPKSSAPYTIHWD